MARRKRGTKRKPTRFNKCVGARLRGRHLGTRAKAMVALKKAIRVCKR